MFGFFGTKKKVDELKKDTKKGFESVKNDILSITGWIKHLDKEKKSNKEEIVKIKEELSSINSKIESLFEKVEMNAVYSNPRVFKQPFKTNSKLFEKQTAVEAVQTAVQTGVQTPNLRIFSITERAIIGILMNSDLKLSYEDIAALLGKEKSTIRGQINAIKSKSESLIEEIVEKNGKKRVFIPENIKEKVLKKEKVSINSSKKKKRTEKN